MRSGSLRSRPWSEAKEKRPRFKESWGVSLSSPPPRPTQFAQLAYLVDRKRNLSILTVTSKLMDLERHYLNFTMVPETSIDDSRHVISVVIDCDEGKQVR